MKVDLEAFAGHTAGPWHISGKQTIKHNNGWIAKAFWNNGPSNARLIAAAPDMAQEIRELRELVKVQHEALSNILPFIPKSSAAEGGAVRFSTAVVASDGVRAALTRAKEAGYV